MSDVHIFRASGDSCPICLALDGHKVAPGFTPHDGCQCQTVPEGNHVDCQWSYEGTGSSSLDGPGPYDKFFGFEVTVKCPDGTEVGASSQFDGHPYSNPDTDFDVFLDLFRDAAQELAQQLCDGCPPRQDEEFRCC